MASKAPWRYRVRNGPLAMITVKRREIIATMRASGATLRRIADEMDMDQRTVERHLSSLRQLGDTRCEARRRGRPRLAVA